MAKDFRPCRTARSTDATAPTDASQVFHRELVPDGGNRNDPRRCSILAELPNRTYEPYAAEVATMAVMVEGYKQNFITGRMESSVCATATGYRIVQGVVQNWN